MNYNIMNERGNIIGSAETKIDAERIAAEYTDKTGIDAYVLDNSKDYTGPAPTKHKRKHPAHISG